MILESTTTRIDGIMKEVQEIKSILQFSQAQIDDLRDMEKKVGSFESQLQSLSSQRVNSEVKDIISKIDYVENQSQPNSVIIDGLKQDTAHKPWSDTEQLSFLTTSWKLTQRLLKSKDPIALEMSSKTLEKQDQLL